MKNSNANVQNADLSLIGVNHVRLEMVFKGYKAR